MKNLTFPATGGWQTWTNTLASVSLPAGELQLRILIIAVLFNINWFEFSFLTSTNDILPIADFQLFPNPVKESFLVKGTVAKKQQVRLQLVDLLGQVLLTKELGEVQTFQQTINFENFSNRLVLL